MLNYLRISQLSTSIVECENAMNKLKSLAKKLAKSKSDLDVEIIITEGDKPAVKAQQMKEGDKPVVMICTTNEMFQQADLYSQFRRQPKQEQYEPKDGLSQKGMPNDLALVMLDSMSNYYKRQKQSLEYLMIDELAKMDIEQLKESQQLEE